MELVNSIYIVPNWMSMVSYLRRMSESQLANLEYLCWNGASKILGVVYVFEPETPSWWAPSCRLCDTFRHVSCANDGRDELRSSLGQAVFKKREGIFKVDKCQ